VQRARNANGWNAIAAGRTTNVRLRRIGRARMLVANPR
jgi:hypothetical protein